MSQIQAPQSNIIEKLGKYCHNIIDKSRSYVKKILKHQPEFTGNKISFLLWIVSISLDPFICYVPSINDEEKFLEINKPLVTAILVLYWPLMIYRFYTSFLSNKKRRQFIIPAESIALFFSHLMLFVVILNPTIKITTPGFSILLLNFLAAYSVRITGIYRFFMEEVMGTAHHLAEAALIKIVLNLLLYLYGGHLFGGMWYLSAICRKMRYWKQVCRNHSGCRYANRHFIVNSGDKKFLNYNCFAKIKDTQNCEIGIYKDAFESRIVDTKEFWKRLLYCFRWGLQNISGFGQSLQLSTDERENIVVILIVIYGVGTFTFFIGNMQNLMKSTTERSEEKRRKAEAIKRKQQELEQWFPFQKLSQELQNHIKEYQQNIWQQTGGVHMENLLLNLPRDIEYNIKRELCLDLFKKVDKFGRLNRAFLVNLCDCLKPIVCLERTRIVHEGDPIDEMLFVVQGKLWTYSSNTTIDTTSNVSCENIKDHLTDGDFWGEELVDWIRNNPSSSNVPKSNRNIRALTKVEAFVLEANDLKNSFIRLKIQNVRFIQSFFRYRRILLSRRSVQISIKK